MSDEIGLKFERYFTSGDNKSAEDYFRWIDRNTEIKNDSDEIIYQGKNLETPEGWSDMATKIVGSKYFYVGNNPTTPVEYSVKQLADRVTTSITEQAANQKILSGNNIPIFNDELKHLVYSQSMAFNSPVWFNVGLNNNYGVTEDRKENELTSSHWAIDSEGNFTNDIDAYERPQGSACFIQSIDDNMESILNHARKEGILFKYGSGTGTNFSTLRAINEPLGGGGVASGMISFLRIYDIIAGRIKSGGKTRRAAKMVICDDDHPDFLRFIMWKAHEEKKALYLSANPEWGPKSLWDLESEAYKTVDGQNGNNSVRVSDEFMNAAINHGDWDLLFKTRDRVKEEKEIPLKDYNDDVQIPDKRFVKALTNKRKTVNAGEAFDLIARAAYVSGDPGIQFDSTINKWHTCPNTGRINASNPCSEFMSVDDSACNLASLNLYNFLPEGEFDINAFESAVATTIVAQETLIDYCSYPNKDITENSHKLRPLGLGYTNIGAVLMSKGIPYDSDQGRAIASAMTSLMTAKAYETSANLAFELGAFEEFEKNKDPMLNVINMHYEFSKEIDKITVSGLEKITDEANKVWKRVISKGKRYGFRNSQVTLLAPTGTIGFMMGVDCTGIEPMIGLKSSKGLAGGGKLERSVSDCVVLGLEELGYNGKGLEEILDYVDDKGSIVGAPRLEKEHYNVFETALGDNIISIDGHLNMMAAVQPVLSGAISKTVNLPKGATIKDIKDTYLKAWKLGIKSVTPYVDSSKGIQPVNVLKEEEVNGLKWGERKKPGSPTERVGFNVNIGQTGVHFIVGEYTDRPPNDSPADFFVEFGSSGSPFSAAYSSWAKATSRNRQRGESLTDFIKHNLGATGVISGLTDHPHIKTCSSPEDFFAKLVMVEYLADTSICEVKPEPEEIENLRCNVLGRRRRQEHFRSRIKFIDTVLNTGEVPEIYPLYEDEVTGEGKIKMGDIFCRVCGNPTVLSGANCRKCPNCGDSLGCG